VSKALCRVERYGFGEGAAWRLKNLRHEDGRTRWEVWREGALWATLEMGMAGEHNALNATAAAALAFGQGVSKQRLRRRLRALRA